MSVATFPATLSPDQILRVAHEDAIKVYKDLNRFKITLRRSDLGWHVEYELIEKVNGGGPHYLIDEVDGSIISKKYYQ